MKIRKKHKIKTLEQLGEIITNENIEEMIGYIETHFRSLLLAKTFDKNTKSCGFTWIDDGKNEVEVIITNK